MLFLDGGSARLSRRRLASGSARARSVAPFENSPLTQPRPPATHLSKQTASTRRTMPPDPRTARRRERTRSQPRLLENTLVSDDDAGDASSVCASHRRGTRVVVARSGRARASYWIDSPRPLLRLVGLCPFGTRTARRPQTKRTLLDNRDASPARARARAKSIS